jgi:CRISPR-associated protein (TIGR03984 family)
VARKIEHGGSRKCDPLELPPDTELKPWLEEQARQYGLRWLLANTDNGIIWGELRDTGLNLSSEAFGQTELRLDRLALQQLRLFGQQGELRIWPGAKGLSARIYRDGQGGAVEWIDEEYLLWGTVGETVADGFTRLVEGAQGIVHSPPLSFTPSSRRRARLRVRHYLAEDDAGVARISDSRLVELIAPGAE